MNLIDEVAKLKELEQKAHYPYLVYVQTDMQTSCACKTDADARFVSDMRNAAPSLLAVLGGFQANDADLIDEILECGILWNEYQSGVLRGYRDMAQAMEGSL